MSDSGESVELPPVISVEELKTRLPELFPEGIPHRNYVVREMAARTIFVMLYTGAVEGSGRWARPAQVTLMTDTQSRATTAATRLKWTRDSLASGVLKHTGKSWYAPNSREPIRDETLRSGLVRLGAVVESGAVPTTSSRPRYALSRDFCELLVSLHEGRATEMDVANWQTAQLSAESLARVRLLKSGAVTADGRVLIQFPNGETRLMIAGPSAEITKSVIEKFVPRFLTEPAVLLVSDSGEKIVARDETLAASIGLVLQTDRNLPDIIVLDLAKGRERLIFIEVVATDGAVTPQRKEALAHVAKEARFATNSVFYITAFRDRGAAAYRKLASEIAWDTFVWFASEPEHLLCYRANARLELESLAVPDSNSGAT